VDEISHIISCDLGKTEDYSALVVVEQRTQPAGHFYTVKAAHRWPLGTPYSCSKDAADQGTSAIVNDVLKILARPSWLSPRLVVDWSGVGGPIVDQLRQEVACAMTPIKITAGFHPHQDGDGWRVPKKDLVGAVQAVLGTRRLLILEGLPFAAVLKDEMGNFRFKQSAETAHTAYNAREGQHDDLVLALACAVWAGEHLAGGTIDNTVASTRGRSLTADAPPGLFVSDEGGRGGRSMYEPRND
jgi:hypothetical protein